MALAPMTPRQSRQLAVLLLVLAIAAVIAAIALPVLALNRHYDNALDDLFGRLERYRLISSTRPEIAKQVEAMRAKESRKFFLRSGAPALSAAEMSEAVRNIVEQNGGRLIAMQPPATREEGRYRQISVNVQLTANIVALRKILHAIENNTPFMFLDNVQIRTNVASNYRPVPGNEPENFVMFDVSGYAPTGS